MVLRRDYPPLEPLDYVDLSGVKASDLTNGAIKGLTQQRYDTDLLSIFTHRAFGSGPTESEIAFLHKKWFAVRRPSSDELWASRYPDHQTATEAQPMKFKMIMRTLVTLQKIREQFEAKVLPDVALGLEILHLDYTFLLCLECQGKSISLNPDHLPQVTEMQHRFPSRVIQFHEMADSLQKRAEGAAKPSEFNNVSGVAREDNP